MQSFEDFPLYMYVFVRERERGAAKGGDAIKPWSCLSLALALCSYDIAFLSYRNKALKRCVCTLLMVGASRGGGGGGVQEPVLPY